MKNYLFYLFFFLLFMNSLSAQQIMSTREFQSADFRSLAPESSKSVFISGTGGTDVLNLDKITASGGLDFTMLFSRRQKWTGRLAFNFSGNIQSSAADTTPLSTLYFPDIGTSAFLASTEISMRPVLKYLFGKNNELKDENIWDAIFVGEIAFQKRNILQDEKVYKFNIQNACLGLGLKWIHENTNSNNYLCVRGVLYPISTLEITGRDENMLSSIFTQDFYDHQKAPLAFNGYSFLVSAEINQTIIYLRSFRDYKSKGDFFFTIGIKAAATFFSF